jgi:Uma2 family endonuclease
MTDEVGDGEDQPADGVRYRVSVEVKLPIYGSSGIPEAWLVDIRRRAVSVYTQPTGGGYVEMVRRTAGEVLSPTAFPDVEIAVADLLPP